LGADLEIERKFLIETLPEGLNAYPHESIVQGYVASARDGNEVRLRQKGEKFFLTIKSGGGVIRREGEIAIDREQFETLWPFTGERVVEKIRYRIECDGRTIELDVYSGRLAGLATAEVEFGSEEESGTFIPPDWFGEEVSEDRRYKNESLALHGAPERQWAGEKR
jgi:adenylate cyclase